MEQEAQRRAGEEEVARHKAQAEKSWPQQAIDMAGQAHENDHKHQALDQYKKSVALLAFAMKQERSDKVHFEIQLKMEEMIRHADELSVVWAAADTECMANSSAQATGIQENNIEDEEAEHAARVLASSKSNPCECASSSSSATPRVAVPSI